MDNPLLDGIRVPVADRVAKVASNPVVVVGTDSTGKIQPLAASGGGVVVGSPVGTYKGFTVAASQTAATGVPTTAKRWILLFRTASGTISYGNSYQDGVNVSITGIGGGTDYGDTGQPVTALTVTTDANTVCDVFYSTT